MLALSFGLIAALLWAIHDLVARKLSQGAPVQSLIAVVLGAGCVALLPLLWLDGDWSAMTLPAWRDAAASGLTMAVAIGGLYKAFSLAPVRLVSPIVGAYPLVTLIIAAMLGRAITPGDWLAVALIVVGIAIVSLATRNDAPEGYAARPAVAIAWSVFAALGFASTFAFAQSAPRVGSDAPVMLVGRVVALAVFVVLIFWTKAPRRLPRRQVWVLSLMGVLDAIALGLVTTSGTLPKAEYASVSSSLFGVLTVLLATWVLREVPRPLQWLGIATVFSGIAILSLQGT